MDDAELKQQIKEFAISEGADLVGFAPVEYYSEYRAEMDRRMKENEASHSDFMMPDSDRNFPERLSSATNALPTAKAIIILAVYAYDEGAVYENTKEELRGKTARTYSYYPVVRQVAEKLTEFMHDLGHKATQGR
ncbi:MAG: hypothetical protein H8D23_03655 [Candidatus Brocadiales bacterium]|nr:hypothetical protein [Candidatus Brocadiales bacterium]